LGQAAAEPLANLALGSIVLKKSFCGDERNFYCGDERNFSGPLMRFARADLRGHIVSHKNDHRPSSALKRIAVSETAKTGPSRDFRCRSIFDFFNSTGQNQTGCPRAAKSALPPLAA
jgi:hypothetical protein